jgi:hypothetical protein
MVARVHVASALRLKLKLCENIHWYLQVCGLVFFRPLSEMYKIYVMEEERI